MRSDEWDDKERKEDNHGYAKRDKKNHEHQYVPVKGSIEDRCLICGLSREEVRKKW
jgi:hypothetical protein